MNTLFVLSQIELTGAETYAVSLIKALQNKGYKLAIVSDTLNSPVEVPYYPLDMDNRKSLFNRLRHIKQLCQIIKQEKIDILHAHSRASSWVAYFASRIAKIPLVTTAHCIYPVHLSRKIMPCFGEEIIAVCGAVKEHLVRDLNVKSEKVFLIPNGIDLQRFKSDIDCASVKEEFRGSSQKRIISWVGRFSGPRGRLIEEMVGKVFPEVLRIIPDTCFLIVGGGISPSSLMDKVEAINQQFGQVVVRLTGLRNDLPQIYALSDLVIGAGRVTLEAMACARPVIAVGENKFVGLISPQTIEDGIYTNFGDCCPYQPTDWKELTQVIVHLLKNKKEFIKLGRWGRTIIEERFDLRMVADKVEEVYEKTQ